MINHPGLRGGRSPAPAYLSHRGVLRANIIQSCSVFALRAGIATFAVSVRYAVPSSPAISMLVVKGWTGVRAIKHRDSINERNTRQCRIAAIRIDRTALAARLYVSRSCRCAAEVLGGSESRRSVCRGGT